MNLKLLTTSLVCTLLISCAGGKKGLTLKRFSEPGGVEKSLEQNKAAAAEDSFLYFPGTTQDVVPATMWRVTALELVEIYEWLFGTGSDFSESGISEDNSTLGLTRRRESLLIGAAGDWSKTYFDISNTASSTAAAKAKFKTVFACTAAESNGACFDRLRDTILVPLFKGPLTAEQNTNYKAIFDKIATTASAKDDAAHTVVTTALRSPYFLFLRDIGASSAASSESVKLSPSENRAFLAVSSSSIVDAMKSLAGPAPELSTEAARKAYLDAALRKPSGVKFMAKFYGEMGSADKIGKLIKDTAAFPEFTPALKTALQKQVEMTLEKVLSSDEASASDLMSTNEYWMTPELAKLYDFKGTIPANGFVEVDTQQRAGFWHLAGIQAHYAGGNESKPMVRGKIFLNNALCATLGTPADAAAVAAFDSAKPTKGVRDRFEAVAASPACASCHAKLNPYGLGMESFNAIGKFRPAYEKTGDVIDPSYESKMKFIAAKQYNNSAEMLKATGFSPYYWQCMVKQVFTQATGLNPEGYDPLLRKAYVSFVRSDLNLRELFVNILSDEALQFRGGAK